LAQNASMQGTTRRVQRSGEGWRYLAFGAQYGASPSTGDTDRGAPLDP